MTRGSRAKLAARVLATLAVLAEIGAPASVRAAGPTFEEATATQAFGEGITVEQRVTLPSGVIRVEAYVRTAGDAATLLSVVANPGAGAHTLTYTDETPPGSLVPNTLVELGFRITLADGTFVDGPPERIRYEDDRFDWRTLEGDVVRVHWYEGTADFGERVLAIGDKAVKEAAELLGVEETLPIDFFVYPERDAFYDVIGPALQENVGGLAVTTIRTLFANIAPSDVADPWVSLVVPHELTHIVFDTATRNPYHEPVHWLNEGLADYLAVGYSSDARSNVERAARANDLMPLRALELQFPSPPSRFSLAYDESVSGVDYLVRTYGQDALVQLIQSYAGGVADDEAFTSALGVDVAGFEAGWLADLGVDDPPPYGPVPAAPGPLPPGWNPAPIQTGPPVATPPPGSGGIGDRGNNDVGIALIVGVGLLFLIVVVLGIVIVARGLNRGDPLLPPPGWQPSAGDEDDEDGAGFDDPARADGDPSSARFFGAATGSEPDRSSDDALPADLAELDARLAPDAQDPSDAPDPQDEPTSDGHSSENRLGDRP